jgi:hypothetical protein
MTCQECTYYFPETENTKKHVTAGECRRFPPQVVQDLEYGEIVRTQVWPLVYGTDWCGEYLKRDEEWKGEPN